jgi:hypothetical protein
MPIMEQRDGNRGEKARKKQEDGEGGLEVTYMLRLRAALLLGTGVDDLGPRYLATTSQNPVSVWSENKQNGASIGKVCRATPHLLQVVCICYI